MQRLLSNTYEVDIADKKLFVIVVKKENEIKNIFIHPQSAYEGLAESSARLLNLLLKANVPVQDITKQLSYINNGLTGMFLGRFCKSLPDAIARILTLESTNE